MLNNIITAIIVAAAIGILLVLLGVFEIAVPIWIIRIGWIVVAAALGIAAIQFLMGLRKPPQS